MIASGIFGMHFGIAIHTKECSERTSEYLFDAVISIINEYDEIGIAGGCDILQIITTKSIDLDICKNDFDEKQKKKSLSTFVYLLKEE